MKTSFPKNKIKIVLLEGVHSDGVRTLEDAGFAVEALPDSPDPRRSPRCWLTRG